MKTGVVCTLEGGNNEEKMLCKERTEEKGGTIYKGR